MSKKYFTGPQKLRINISKNAECFDESVYNNKKIFSGEKRGKVPCNCITIPGSNVNIQ